MISLNKKFYSPEAVKAALLIYGELCAVDIHDDEKTIKVSVKKKNGTDNERLEREFSNYCLAWIKQNGI